MVRVGFKDGNTKTKKKRKKGALVWAKRQIGENIIKQSTYN